MANNFTTDPNCVALWRMESGALTADSIGTNTLTNHGVAEDAVNFKEGACAADFESTESDYMIIGDAALNAGFPLKSGDTSKKYSFAFWVKFESVGAVITKGYTGYDGFQLTITAGGVLKLENCLETFPWNIATIVSGRWYHIGIAGDGVLKTVTARIWDDTAGTATTYTHTFTNEITVGSKSFVIGSIYNGLASFLGGLFDELVVFKDVKTVADFDLIRTGWYGAPLLAGTIAAVSSVQGNIRGVSTLLAGTVAAVSSLTGGLTGGALQLGNATADAVSGITADLTIVVGPVPIVIGSGTGGWAMGGAGVWASSTPTDTEIPAPAEPTGFYLGGGAAAGEAEVVSTIPGVEAIVTEGAPFIFCGPGATGDAATIFPASETILAEAGFKFGGAGVWGQVSPEDLPSDVLVGSGGFVLSGSGFALDPGVVPTATEIISAGGWRLGGIRPDPIEVTYPDSVDRIIISSGGWTFGGDEGVWESSVPSVTVIESLGALYLLGGGGLATSKPPPIAVITGDALGGFVLGGGGLADLAEVFEAWCLSGQAFEPSVWSGFNFNSFAVKGGQAYAAGNAGIYLLGADHDAGETIQSGVRIEKVNLGNDKEKRIRSIQFGSAGRETRVRVKSEEGEGVFVVDRDDNRVIVSRDIIGREFTIDLMDFEELSHCEITPLRLARR